MSRHSAIYIGHVRHHRFEPVVNRFTYGLSMLYLDLDEIDSVFDRNWFWSKSGFNLASFRQEDHLRSLRKDKSQSLKELVRKYLESKGIPCGGPIRLLTQIRYLGFAMNPASFFYCFDDDEGLVAIITQVNNTPWGEEHLYLIDARGCQQRNIGIDNLTKEFHVSPFMPMDMQYSMRYSMPSRKLAVKMINYQSEEKKLDVVLSLSRKNMTTMNLNWLLVTYPMMSIKVFVAIYWQALKLWMKKVPFFSHPAKSKRTENQVIKNKLPVTKAIN